MKYMLNIIGRSKEKSIDTTGIQGKNQGWRGAKSRSLSSQPEESGNFV
jgi:hypothetical protein